MAHDFNYAKVESTRTQCLIMYSISKYRLLSRINDETDLLHHALKSQQNMPHNSYKTITYYKISATLLNRFDMTDFPKF